MENNKFFKFVWRFNGLVISVAGVLAIGVLLFVAYKLFQDITRDRTTRNIVNIEENITVKENWKLGQFSKVGGTNVLMVPLHSDQSFNRAYFSKSSNSTRNYLFIDVSKSHQQWLFNHTNYLIERSERLRLGDYNSEKQVLAILYYLVKLDSDHDSRLTKNDLTTIALTKPDGTGYKELLKDIDLVVGYELLNEKELFIIYQKSGVSYSTILNLASLELTQTKEVPKVGL